jgi:membrane protein implicated in regulation of membrane protease activity
VSVVQFFLSTANLPFVFALGVSVLFVVLQWSGLLGLLGGGGDADADGDVDGDADVDADADGDVDGDADADDADADDADADDADAEDAAPAMLRLPLTVRAPVAAIAFAMTGFALNALLYAEAPAVPLLTLLWTLPSGILSGFVAGKLMARVLAPLLDDRRNAAPERRSLVGRIGTVISTAVSADFGEVRIKDESGHQLRVVVKLAEDAAAPREGDEVVVVDLDERGTPKVAPLNLRLTTPR